MLAISTPLTNRLDDFAAFWTGYLETDDATVLQVAADWCGERGDEEMETALRAFSQPLWIGRRQMSVRMFRKDGRPHSVITSFAAAQSRFRAETYWHRTIEAAAKYIGQVLAAHQERTDVKEAKRDRIAAAKSSWVNPHKVGDLLYHMWGYDQTNFDFAQIVAVGPRSVTIRRIGCRTIRESGFMSSEIAPVKDSFLSQVRRDEPNNPKTIAIRFHEYDGKLVAHIPGWSLVGNRETFHETHYA